MSNPKKGSSKTPGEIVKYAEGDLVLGKIKGYPPWPGKVINPESAPPEVKKEMPPVKKATYYLVRFYPTADHAWLVAKDMSMLQRHEIEAYMSEPHRKNAELMEGYKTALNPETWEAELQAKIERKAEEEAAMQNDELAEEEAAPAAVAGKKRKRESTAGDKKADKKAKKSKLEQLSQKRKSLAKKSDNELLESEDEGAADESKIEADTSLVIEKPAKSAHVAKGEDDEVEDAALQSDPEAKKVRDWRHKLQKTFLSKGGPVVSEMASADQVFKAAEDYQGYTLEYLQFSKIGKVMRKIATAAEIPRDGEFNFRERAQALVARWSELLPSTSSGPKTNGDVPSSKHEDVEMKDDAPAPAVNGEAKAAEPAPPETATSAEAPPAADAAAPAPAEAPATTTTEEVIMTDA